MSRRIFITGTDTEIGKTYITTGLIEILQNQGYRVFASKPIASGGEYINNELCNDDALAIQSALNVAYEYSLINPICLSEPITPHLAAERHQLALDCQSIVDACQPALAVPADFTLFEGCGGWLVPLNDHETIADVVVNLQCAVILVVGMRLGCLNHSMLSYRVLLQYKVPILGWVANCIDPNMLALQENIQTLKTLLPIPCLGVVPYQQRVVDHLSLVTNLL